MKKYLLSLALIIPILFLSCTKEKEDNNPLVGTKWYANNYSSSLYGAFAGEGVWNIVYEFKTNETLGAYFYNLTYSYKGKQYEDSKYEYFGDGIRMFKEDGSYGDTYYFRSSTWLCTKKEGEGGTSYSLYKEKPQWE